MIRSYRTARIIVQTVTEIKLEVFKDLPKLIEKAYGIPWNLPMIGEVSVGPNMSDLTEKLSCKIYLLYKEITNEYYDD